MKLGIVCKRLAEKSLGFHFNRALSDSEAAMTFILSYLSLHSDYFFVRSDLIQAK